MFGKLQYYKNEKDYYKDHLFFQVLTPDRIYRYQVFAFNDVSDTSDVYTISFANDQEYVDFIKMVKQQSQVAIDVPDVAQLNATDDAKLLENYKKLVTLSTCTADENMRFVVVGTVVGEYDRVNKKLIYDSIDR